MAKIPEDLCIQYIFCILFIQNDYMNQVKKLLNYSGNSKLLTTRLMKTCRGEGLQLHSRFISAPDGGEYILKEASFIKPIHVQEWR
jgi:hypothetical protein